MAHRELPTLRNSARSESGSEPDLPDACCASREALSPSSVFSPSPTHPKPHSALSPGHGPGSAPPHHLPRPTRVGTTGAVDDFGPTLNSTMNTIQGAWFVAHTKLLTPARGADDVPDFRNTLSGSETAQADRKSVV